MEQMDSATSCCPSPHRLTLRSKSCPAPPFVRMEPQASRELQLSRWHSYAILDDVVIEAQQVSLDGKGPADGGADAQSCCSKDGMPGRGACMAGCPHACALPSTILRKHAEGLYRVICAFCSSLLFGERLGGCLSGAGQPASCPDAHHGAAGNRAHLHSI